MQKVSLAAKSPRLFKIKLFSFVLLFCLLVAAVLFIENLLVSLVAATVIVFLTEPFVTGLEARGLERTKAIIFMFLATTAVSILLLLIFAPLAYEQFMTLKSRIPVYIEGATQLFGKADVYLQSIAGSAFDIDFVTRTSNWLLTQTNNLVSTLPNFLSASISVFFLSPLLGFFILKDGRRFSRDFLSLVPNEYFELVLNMQYQINQQIGFFIRARILEALIVGGVVLIGLWSVGFPYAVILSIFAALTNLIPYIGPIIGAIPPIIIGLMNHDSSIYIMLVMAVYILAQLVDMFVIIPLIVAKIVNMHPVTVILVVILGAQFMGVLGMIISIPVASACKVALTSFYKHLTDYSN
jgi:putative permease